MTLRNPLRTGSTLVAAALIAGCALEPLPPVGASRPWDDEAARFRARPAPVAPRVEVASWYGEWHQGLPTASGEPYDMGALTAAHRSLPLGTCVEVLHLGNGRRVLVRVNDRGPYVPGRTIDLSYRAAEELGMVDAGVASVRIRRAKPEGCESSPERL
jgi:rare lipoprotein A